MLRPTLREPSSSPWADWSDNTLENTLDPTLLNPPARMSLAERPISGRLSSSSMATAAPPLSSPSPHRVRRVRYYPPGEAFGDGAVYSVSPAKFRTWESLLQDLTLGTLEEGGVEAGVFSQRMSQTVECLEEVQDGDTYVCASSDIFRDGDDAEDPSGGRVVIDDRLSHTLSSAHLGRASEADQLPDGIAPRLVTFVWNDQQPRKAVRVLLNRRTVRALEQLIEDLTKAMRLQEGSIKRLFNYNGKQVRKLADLLHDSKIFVATAAETLDEEDLTASRHVARHSCAYRRPTKKRERITLLTKLPHDACKSVTVLPRIVVDSRSTSRSSRPPTPEYRPRVPSADKKTLAAQSLRLNSSGSRRSSDVISTGHGRRTRVVSPRQER